MKEIWHGGDLIGAHDTTYKVSRYLRDSSVVLCKNSFSSEEFCSFRSELLKRVRILREC